MWIWGMGMAGKGQLLSACAYVMRLYHVGMHKQLAHRYMRMCHVRCAVSTLQLPASNEPADLFQGL